MKNWKWYDFQMSKSIDITVYYSFPDSYGKIKQCNGNKFLEKWIAFSKLNFLVNVYGKYW